MRLEFQPMNHLQAGFGEGEGEGESEVEDEGGKEEGERDPHKQK